MIWLGLLRSAEGHASDGPLTVALEYVAAPGCPKADDFKAVVGSRLHYDPFRDDAPENVLVHIVARGHTLEGRLEWRNAAGEWAGDQTFPSRNNDCGALARAIGFSLAVQMEILAASASASSSVSSPTDVPAGPAASAPAASNVPAPTASGGAPGVANTAGPPSPRPRPELVIGAGASAGFGLSSSVVPLARLFGGVAWTRLSLELAAEVSLPATTRRADGAGFSQQVLLASAAACGVQGRWSACLFARGGEVRIVGEAIDVPASPSGPVLEAGLRVMVKQGLGRRSYVALRAESTARVTRWTVTLDRMPVWPAPRFAATMGLDLGLRFQ